MARCPYREERPVSEVGWLHGKQLHGGPKGAGRGRAGQAGVAGRAGRGGGVVAHRQAHIVVLKGALFRGQAVHEDCPRGSHVGVMEPVGHREHEAEPAARRRRAGAGCIRQGPSNTHGGGAACWQEQLHAPAWEE